MVFTCSGRRVLCGPCVLLLAIAAAVPPQEQGPDRLQDLAAVSHVHCAGGGDAGVDTRAWMMCIVVEGFTCHTLLYVLSWFT